MIGTKIPI